MAQDLGVYQDTVPAGGRVVIQANVQVLLVEGLTILSGGSLEIQAGGRLVVMA